MRTNTATSRLANDPMDKSFFLGDFLRVRSELGSAEIHKVRSDSSLCRTFEGCYHTVGLKQWERFQRGVSAVSIFRVETHSVIVSSIAYPKSQLVMSHIGPKSNTAIHSPKIGMN